MKMGKGSKPRPMAVDKKKFDEAFDLIFKTRKKTPGHGQSQVHLDKKKQAKKDNFGEVDEQKE